MAASIGKSVKNYCLQLFTKRRMQLEQNGTYSNAALSWKKV